MKTFCERLLSMGYEQKDGWRISQSLYVPLHSNHIVKEFRGFYFERSISDSRHAGARARQQH